MMTLAAFCFLLVILAVLLWGGDRLLALVPGNTKLKEAARTIIIVVIAITLICTFAAFLGVRIPWFTGFVHFRAG
jgi:hypothetical protein